MANLLNKHAPPDFSSKWHCLLLGPFKRNISNFPPLNAPSSHALKSPPGLYLVSINPGRSKSSFSWLGFKHHYPLVEGVLQQSSWVRNHLYCWWFTHWKGWGLTHDSQLENLGGFGETSFLLLVNWAVPSQMRDNSYKTSQDVPKIGSWTWAAARLCLCSQVILHQDPRALKTLFGQEGIPGIPSGKATQEHFIGAGHNLWKYPMFILTRLFVGSYALKSN